MEIAFKIIISVVAIILTYFIIPFIKGKIDELKDDKLKQIIYDAVWAAQQTLIDNEQKKNYVFGIASDWLKQHNIEISAVELDMLIESAVLSMKTETK